MSPLRKLLFGILVSGGILGALEGALRVFLPEDALLYSWERADGMLAVGGVRLLPKPGHSGPHMDGQYAWSVEVNTQTLREDARVPHERAPGQKRLLGLGDSWMFGISVTQGKTIADQLEDRLEAAGWAESVDVINAGVPSFSAFDVLWRWQTFADTFDVDGVLVTQPHNMRVGTQHPEDRLAWYHAMGVSAPSDWRVYRLLRRVFDRFRRTEYAVPPTGALEEEELADLLTLVREVRAKGLPVYFLLLPAAMDQATAEQMMEPAVGGPLREAGAVVGGHSMPDRACWGQEDHGHPSERGAAALADVAAKLVLEGKSMPVTRTGC